MKRIDKYDPDEETAVECRKCGHKWTMGKYWYKYYTDVSRNRKLVCSECRSSDVSEKILDDNKPIS